MATFIYTEQKSLKRDFMQTTFFKRQNALHSRVVVTLNHFLRLFIHFSWSYGILLWEMWTLGDIPYAHLEPIEMADHLKSGARLSKPGEHCPDAMYFDEFC